KVVFNESNDLIYISRSLIPGSKKQNDQKNQFYRQVCIYGFSKDHLNAFGAFNRKSILEEKEDIEILRFFELSIPIKVFLSRNCGPAVDYPEDIQKVLKYLKGDKK
ncbi:3-deoxy-manno-octulosonate cytidylyltransferase, partial [Prochlorococcus sp. AH-716-I07]|nr:3-deoxy-manno-octulosonate cytidylyltransferase [Prochlorococcus sp. AH-716-I07]